MKLKLLLLFLVIVVCGSRVKSQTTLPYTNLVITEAQMHASEENYFEITNMGTETVNLKNFEFGHLGAWDSRATSLWPQVWASPGFPKFMMLPDKVLAPGQSFLFAAADDFNPKFWKHDPANYRERVTRKEFYSVNPKTKKVSSIADMLLHIPEYKVQPWKGDSVSPNWNVIEGWGGRETYFLRHHFINPTTQLKDSVTIDQVGGVFDEADNTNTGGSYNVAGVVGATDNCILIRRNSVKTGNLDFNKGRGVDFADSEWIPIKIPGFDQDWYNISPWRAVFWTAGNQVNATFTANTLVSKTGKVLVDLAKNTITVPWGVRRNDSIMFQFKKTPGLAWEYIYSKNHDDSTYMTARTDDTLKVYACGDKVDIKKFSVITLAPTKDDNIVIPRMQSKYWDNKKAKYVFVKHPYNGYGGMRVTDGVSPIDSITNLSFAVRVDTLYKYLEKAPKASWKIVFKDGVAKPDLKNGDILRVTSESGKSKDYFLKLEKYTPESNALLGSITWPDMPASFKGDIATNLGWKHDTIPGFSPSGKTYVVQVPLDYDGIPALIFKKQSLNSKVVVSRAKTLAGSVADRTVTCTVTAENDTVKSVYTVRFDKEKDFSNVQPFIAEPFISQMVFRAEWSTGYLEIANPGTAPLDLSNYMLAAAWATEPNAFNWNNSNSAADWGNRYMKYIPGKKWQDQANWTIQPRIAVPDPAVNAIVYPQDVFVMAQYTNDNGWVTADKNPYMKQVDINFGTVPTSVPGHEKLSNPWNENIDWKNIPSVWCNNVIVLYKILNDSVKSGLKPANNRKDFQIIDQFGGKDGNNWVIGGFNAGSQEVGFTRKSKIYKGNPLPNGSFGTNNDDSEWTHQRPSDFSSFNLGWPWTDVAISTGIGSLSLDEITVYRSTVSSKVYKVSPGYSTKETIRGLTTGTTVSGFYANIIKANPLQTLTVKSAATGATLADAAVINKGDILNVLSADSVNTSKYVLDVTATGLSNNATLTSTQYTINVTGTTGTIAGFPQRTKLSSVLAGVVVPAGASLTITDENDAYMSLNKLNYDTAYVNVVATDKIYFEVIAENGTNKVLYQLKPTASPSDAYVTSDVYSVNQFASLIQFVVGGTSVYALLNNITPAPDATVAVYDKDGFLRTEGTVYKDDKLVVTAKDGKTTKAYYFSMLNFYANQYFAYVISDDYTIDQVKRVINVASTGIDISEFYAKLYPSFGAKLSVIDKNGVASKLTKLASYDQLLVTAADNVTTATYKIQFATKAVDPSAATIKMYPNPTTDGRVIIQGLSAGNRVRVFNVAGITLRDVTVDSSTEYVSLAAQPAGIYVFVISSGDQFINIQKIVKK